MEPQHVEQKGCGKLEKRARKPTFLLFCLLTGSLTKHVGSMFDEDRNIRLR